MWYSVTSQHCRKDANLLFEQVQIPLVEGNR